METVWLAGGPLLRVATIRRATDTHTTDTFLSISHTTNVHLFKFRYNIFIGVRIIKEMTGSVASGTLCISTYIYIHTLNTHLSEGLLWTVSWTYSFGGRHWIFKRWMNLSFFRTTLLYRMILVCYLNTHTYNNINNQLNATITVY